jgi:hypothetical protein
VRRGSRDNDLFYIDDVAPALQHSKLDRWLAPLRRTSALGSSTLRRVLEAHGYLCEVFQALTGLQKRALASKYLHFHVPQLFFLYDSRARKALRGHRASPFLQPPSERCDPAYRSFVLTAYTLQQTIAESYSTTLTPRQLDRLFLRAAAANEVIELGYANRRRRE